MAADHVDALVIFGATRDLAKMETFPALVGLVERGLAPLPRNNERPVLVWPESAVSLRLAGKKAVAGWEPQMDDLAFAERPGSDQRPLRSAHRRRARRRAVAVRPAGHRRGRPKIV